MYITWLLEEVIKVCDRWLLWKLKLGYWKFLTVSPILGMYFLPIVPTLGTIFNGTDLREPCFWDHLDGMPWLNPVKVSLQTLRFWWLGVKIYSFFSQLRQASYTPSLAYCTCHLPTWSGLAFFLLSLPSMYRDQFTNQQCHNKKLNETWKVGWDLLMPNLIFHAKEIFLLYSREWVSKESS